VTTSKIPEIAPCKPVLAYGSKGESVKLLQKDINYINTKYNLKMPTLSVDGMFGNGTMNNLKTIQTKYNITPDGEYGKDSYNVFLNLLK
jgi:peptidoglycan hydrolase-like protein with peptidoglycan-binding domain